MDVASVLLAAQSPDASVRTPAEAQIESAKQSNMPLLMSLIAAELANEAQEASVRQLAGVLLKNCVNYVKPELVGTPNCAAWNQVGSPEREQVKQHILGCLGSAMQQARHTAAQVVAAIGVQDLPLDRWPELIQGLVNNVTTSGNDFLKQSSLEALGFICEEVDAHVLERQSNLILTAVIQGMRKEEPNLDVRLAGTTALLNALEFVKTNFDTEAERNYIMQTVCEGTQCERKEIKVASYECLVQVAELYYDKLPQYMTALFQLTCAAIQAATQGKEDDEVGQQAIEFWTTVCDAEIDIAEEAEDARLSGTTLPPNRTSHRFVHHGLQHLVPLLLEGMCMQEEDADDDSWNMALASSTCLAKVAETVADDVVGHVMPFLEKHINSTDWRRREASVLAFGSILEGPSSQSLAPFMTQAVDVMIQKMHDPSVQVKDTTAWTIGRICEHHTASISPTHWHAMMCAPDPAQNQAEGVLLTGLRDDPRVAANVCCALHNLAGQLEETRSQQTNALSALFVTIARALLAASEREDASEHNLRCSAYEALNTTLANAAEDTRTQIEQLMPIILQRLEGTFALQIVSNDDREAQLELQGLLCGTLQVITQKLGPASVPFADRMMQTFLQLFGQKNSTVQEEALMAVGALATATEADFEKYMPHFRPFLSLGLSNWEEHQVCAVAIGVVGDICRALEAKAATYCDEIVALLLRNLQNPALNRNVKPPILSCFGDIALAIGGHFEKYMNVTMTMLVQASSTSIDEGNPDLVEYLNELREGIFEAYTGVLQGLRADGKAAAFEPYVMGALDLVRQVAEGVPKGILTDSVLRASVGMLGDLGLALGGRGLKNVVRQAPHRDYLKALLKEARNSPNEATKQVGNWANQTIFSPS